jgi:colanic acid biosynthesis glycosyl transferase WcaI
MRVASSAAVSRCGEIRSTELDREMALKIAYINQDFPPEVGAGPARVLEMSRRWQSAGAEVTVITGMPWRRMAGRPDGAIHPDYRGRLFMEEQVEGIRVLRSWLYASPNRGFAHTLVNNASFALSGTLNAWLRGGRFDVVIASSPPFLAHVTGESLRFTQRVPLVLEIRDLWPDYMVEMGVLKSPLAQRLLFGLERRLLRRASRVVVVTESFRERVAAKGFARDAIDVISNGANLDQYYRDAAPLPVAALERRPGELIVGYLGNFGAGQEIRTVVEAARLLEARAPRVRFVLAGDGNQKAGVEALAAELGLRNLSIHPPIEKDRTRAFYNACDLCLVPLAPVPIFSETVPSKIFEVMACERPVLASVAGEAARIVETSGAGRVTPPGDARAMADGIEGMLARSAEERAALGRKGRAYVAAHFSRAGLADRYLEILYLVANRRRPVRGAADAAPADGVLAARG